jgi:DNA-binding response OmpR family regulator
MHIIVVEPFEGYRSLVCEYLSEHLSDVTVTGLEFGKSALQLVAARGAGLVITSQYLHDMLGFTLIRALHTEVASIPVIMLSGDADLVSAALLAGAACFVWKCDGLHVLLAAVQAVIRSTPAPSPP